MPRLGEEIFSHSDAASAKVLIMWFSYRFSGSSAMITPSVGVGGQLTERIEQDLGVFGLGTWTLERWQALLNIPYEAGVIASRPPISAMTESWDFI